MMGQRAELKADEIIASGMQDTSCAEDGAAGDPALGKLMSLTVLIT